MPDERTPLELVMFAAWCNVAPDDVPTEYRLHVCEATKIAWQRVAKAAREHLEQSA